MDSIVCRAGLARQFVVIRATGAARALGPAGVFTPL
jgi:hypothetical protein